MIHTPRISIFILSLEEYIFSTNLKIDLSEVYHHRPPPPHPDDATARGHDAERPHRRPQGQRQLEVLARHRPARRRHRHPRVSAKKVRPNIS